MTSGASPINSAAHERKRSVLPSPQQVSTRTFLPSIPRLQPLQERLESNLSLGIVGTKVHEHADLAHPIRLLRANSGWPCRRSATDECHEFAPPHASAPQGRLENAS